MSCILSDISDCHYVNQGWNLDGLVSDSHRDVIVSNKQYRVGQLYTHSCSLTLEASHNLLELQRDRHLTHHSLVLFVWHKVISVFGHTQQTAVLTPAGVSQDGIQTRWIRHYFDHDIAIEVPAIDSVLQISNALEDDRIRQVQIDPELIAPSHSMLVESKAIPNALMQKVPLLAQVNQGDDGRIQWTISYDHNLFSEVRVIDMLQLVEVILTQFAAAPAVVDADLVLLNDEQKDQHQAWNDTDDDFPSEQRLHQLFEVAASHTPFKEAVVYRGKSLTYKALNQGANQIAHWLLKRQGGVDPKQITALFLNTSELQLLAVIGVWKSGAAYVPIDPNYPDERVRFILNDTGVSVILTNAEYTTRLLGFSTQENSLDVIDFDALAEKLKRQQDYPVDNPVLGLTSEDPAYITYTSGTTGVPKGVLKCHKSVVNSITDLSVRYRIGEEQQESVALFSPYVFEPFVRQLLIALINSQRLIVIDETEKLDPNRFPAFIKSHDITYLNGTASALQQYDFSDCPSLRRLLLVGEELTPSRYNQLRKVYKYQIINEYAFTESAFVTATKIFEANTPRDSRSIGHPLRNVKCYVLNSHLKQLPVGAVGELFIGGAGVAKGYINRPELTQDRFLPNSLRTEKEVALGINERLYRTGDLALVNTQGEIEFLGRNDFQIKLNGIRIEPGEIESVAVKYPNVTSCIVVLREVNKASDNPARHLIGYYVSDKLEVPESNLMNYLESQLPRYLMPARMIRMDSIPVNTNGKADLKALPDICELAAVQVCVEARDELDTSLCQIWSEVLGFPLHDIGITDDFFRLGGSSISSIILIAQVYKKLQVTLSVEDIFRLKTIEKVADVIAERRIGEEVITVSTVTQKTELSKSLMVEGGEQEVYLANSLQQGFMYQYLKKREAGNNDDYIMQSLLTYHAAICPETFKAAWRYIQNKYGCLRTRFHWNDEPLQIILQEQELTWEDIDLSGESDFGKQQDAINQLQKRDSETPYRLDMSTPFRIYLIKQSTELFTCIFSCHHIILDGWSLAILFNEFHRAYWTLSKGKSLQPSRDTAYESSLAFLQANRNEHADYWRRQIEGIDVRGDYNGLVRQEKRYKVTLTEYEHVENQQGKTLEIGAELTKKIRALCTQHGMTLHSLLQFVWHKVLHVVGNAEQTVVGTIVSGRGLPIDNIEHAVGLFINTLPLIVDHTAKQEKSVLEVIREIQSQVNSMNSYSNVELGQLHKGEMKKQLFDTLFVLENYPDLDLDLLHELDIQFEASYELEKVDYPLAVIARDTSCDIHFTLWHAAELFTESTVDMLLDMVNLICQQVVEDIAKPVNSFTYLTESQQQLQESWNETETPFPEKQTLHGRFEDVANRYPERIALVYEQTHLSYRELNNRANQLAHKLRIMLMIQPNKLIALVLDKNEHMFTSIIGVWKSGTAYVPIAPAFPQDRIEFILQDIQAKLIITNHRYVDMLRAYVDDEVQIIAIDKMSLDGMSTANQESLCCSTDLAYVMYTSGTTGRPKGVMVEHRGVLNLQVSLANIFNLAGEQPESFLSFSNYIFDHFIEQMTDGLLNGQKLVVLNDDMRSDKARLYRYIQDNQVTYLSGTPSVLSMYEFDSLPSLTRIDAIGEDFTETLFNKIRSTFAGQIINGYGPTEVSITTHKRLYASNELRQDKSIGFPVANTIAYILDDNIQRLPIGCVGVLFLGGVGVARGYFNREDLSQERFVANPFQTEKEKAKNQNSRIYKTGDLARWLPNGEVEYLGRTDTQVKIRGLRIELAEIETVLTDCPGVKHAVVIARSRIMRGVNSDIQKYLVGFYLCEQDLKQVTVMAFLRSRLPEFMVPNQVMCINSLPVTPSGKLDVKHLPETEFLTQGETYVAPSNDIDNKLCTIWSDVLGVPVGKIGVNDSFFSLGGDSIMATRLAYTIAETMDKTISVAKVFEANTIGLQHKWLLESSAEVPIVTSRLPNVQSPVSLAQERLLFIEEFENGTCAYNIAIHLTLPVAVNEESLIKALQQLVMRHSILRTLIDGDEQGVWQQQAVPKKQAMAMLSIDKQIFKIRADMDEAMISEEKHLFALDRELPIRIRLFKNKQDSQLLYLTLIVHHTCFDGWSWLVLHRDFEVLYRYYSGASEQLTLPRLNLHYSDFAEWQRGTLCADKSASLNLYWHRKLQGHQSLNLQLDYPRPVQFDYMGKEVEFNIDTRVAENLRVLAKQLNVSLYSVLVGTYCLMLSQYTNQQDIVIGMPFANRNQPELADMVGFFANLLILRIEVAPRLSLADYLRSVSREIIAAQIHQELPFEQLVKNLGVERDSSRNPIVQVVFALDLLEKHLQMDDAEQSALELNRYKPDARDKTSAKYDLSAWISENEQGLVGNFTYAKSLFKEKSVVGFTHQYQYLLTQLSDTLSDETTLLTQLTSVCYKARHHLLCNNGNTVQYGDSPSLCLHNLVEHQAAHNPDKVAVIYERTELSYAELNRRANKLAYYLRQHNGVREGDLIALLLDKSEEMIISILAVWKAGAAYVPMDPNYPIERIRYMLSDSSSKILVTQGRYRELTIDYDELKQRVDVDDVAIAECIAACPDTNCNVTLQQDALAYVIYTSGTTGKPKGVFVAHASVLNLKNDLINRYFDSEQEAQQCVLMLANYVFDFSIEQLIVSLLMGNKLILYSVDQSENTFYQHANRHGLSFISGTPTQIQQFDLSRLAHLQLVVVAGEPFTHNHFEKIRRQYSGNLVNAYGVTETTVYNTVKLFRTEDEYVNSLGWPLSNMKVFVLNEQLQLLPKGAVGELYLAGECVCQGYLNRPELSASLFISNPYQSAREKRCGFYGELYKTGDLVRYLENGELSYIGRNDQQVKINGLRIELGEVESVLGAFPCIEQCVVTTLSTMHQKLDTSSDALVGYYYSPTQGVEEDVRGYLERKLPSFMVPKQLVSLADALPMTPNGKVDLAALPKLAEEQVNQIEATPRNAVERQLQHIWSGILRRDNFGTEHNFFTSGGDSISAMALVSQMQGQLNQHVRIKDLFDYPTIQSLYDNVLKHRKFLTEFDAEQGQLQGALPLLPIQSWFFAKSLHHPHQWNQSFGIRTPPLDLGRLYQSIDALVAYHDVFRLRFSYDAGKHHQFYVEQQYPVPFHTLDVSGLSREQVQTRLIKYQSCFDLHTGPAYCFVYLHGFNDSSAMVWVAAHHLLIDTVSWRILTCDLQRLYDGGDLGKKGSSYRQWTKAVENQVILEEELAYWENLLSDLSDNSQAFSATSMRNQQGFTLGVAQTLHLMSDCHQVYDTQINDILLTALSQALSQIDGSREHYVTLEAHGRGQVDSRLDINSTIGWFTSMYPSRLTSKSDIRSSILAAKEARLAVPFNGLGFGAHFGYVAASMPTISFNYLGQFNENQKSGELWGLDQAYCDNLRHPQDLQSNGADTDITIICNGDRLSVAVDTRMTPAWRNRLVVAFERCLEALIEHTMEAFEGKPEIAKRNRPVASRFEPYVEFNQSHKDAPILFILPPGEGGAESYFNNLAKYLPDFRLVIFNNCYLQHPLKGGTFESLAHYYLEYVQSIQPHGTYHFLGWSFGAVLSMEMASQLVEAEECIGSLHLIDPYFNATKASSDAGLSLDSPILDSINYLYRPNLKSLECLASTVGSLVLFKAMKMNDNHKNEAQRKLYACYLRSELNYLDTLIDRRHIQVIPMLTGSHTNWTNNKALIEEMCVEISSNVLTYPQVKTLTYI